MSGGDRQPRPDPLAFDPKPVPGELRERDQWVCWRYEWDADRDEWTKVPIKPYDDRDGVRENVDEDHDGNGEPEKPHDYAGSTWRHTWRSFDDAVAYHDRDDTDTDGVGFVVHGEDLVFGYDLDDCRDPDTGDLEAWAAEFLDDVPTYAEVSPGKGGLRGFGFGFIPEGGNRADVDGADGHLELYDTGRYLTVTGHHVDGTPADVRQVHDEIADVHAEYIADDADDESLTAATNGGVDTRSPDATPGDGGSEPEANSSGNDLTDTEVIERAKNAENGDYFTDLWEGRWKKHRHRWETSADQGQSEADLALCGMLAFYTGGDHRQIDRLFRQSDLYRAKWDADRGAQTYGERTIAKTLEGRTEFYDPPDLDNTELTPDNSAPPDRVESDLIDTLLEDIERWLDPETQTWTVRATDDHDAETIADALADGNLPGDADAALADAVLGGDIPPDHADALQSWRQDPDAWAVDVARAYSETTLTPAAIAAAAGVDPDDLGNLKNNELAELVWQRVRKHDSHHFLTRQPDETLFAYDHASGTWTDTGEGRARAIGYDALGTAFTQGVRRELVERIRATRSTWVDANDLGAPAETVPVANGLLELDDRTLRALAPDDHVLSRLPVEYDPEADCPRFTQYLKEVVPNAADRHVLQEYVGYCLMHWGLPFHRALFVVGPQSSGKSTFLTVVKQILGDDATCSLAPQEFTEERFAGYDLVGSWANIRSDIPADLIENTGKFKEVVASDPVKVERKYEDPVTVEPTAKHLFAANTLPSAEIEDNAFFRRILLVSFPDTIPREDRDPKLGTKLESELPGILNWALDGLSRLRDDGRFTGDYGPETVRETWDAWGQSVARFKSRCLEINDSAAREAKAVVYDAYTRFCKAEGIPAESRRKFTRELKKDGAIDDGARVTVDGEQMRAYTGIALLDKRILAPPDVDNGPDTGRSSLGDYQ